MIADPPPKNTLDQKTKWDWWMSPLYWLAGCRWEALRECPPTERERLAVIGSSVLIPTVMGFFGMFFYVYARNRHAPPSIWLCLGVALLWSLVILNTDRLLLATYRPFQPWHRKLMQGLFRLLLAGMVSAAISFPFCLDQFRPAIRHRYDTEYTAALSAQKSELDSKRKELRDSYETQKKALGDALLPLQTTIIDPELSANQIIDEQRRKATAPDFTAPASAETSRVLAEVSALEGSVRRFSQEKADQEDFHRRYLNAADLELRGLPNEFYPQLPGETKLGGPGTRHKDLQRRGGEAADAAQLASAGLKTAQEGLAKANRQLAVQRNLDAQQHVRSLESNRLKHVEDARKRDQARAEQIVALQKERTLLDEEYKKSNDRLDERYGPKIALYERKRAGDLDPLEETLGLFRVIFVPEPDATEPERAQQNYRWMAGALPFVIIFGTLFLIDLIPILAKMLSRPGAYDVLVEFSEMVPRENFTVLRHNYPIYAARWVESFGDPKEESKITPGIRVSEPADAAASLLFCHLPIPRAASKGYRVRVDSPFYGTESFDEVHPNGANEGEVNSGAPAA